MKIMGGSGFIFPFNQSVPLTLVNKQVGHERLARLIGYNWGLILASLLLFTGDYDI